MERLQKHRIMEAMRYLANEEPAHTAELLKAFVANEEAFDQYEVDEISSLRNQIVCGVAYEEATRHQQQP